MGDFLNRIKNLEKRNSERIQDLNQDFHWLMSVQYDLRDMLFFALLILKDNKNKLPASNQISINQMIDHANKRYEMDL